MENTIQLYIDEENDVKGYPLTSPDRVIDENGVSVKQKLIKMDEYDILSRSSFTGITKKENIFTVLGGIDSLTNGAGAANNNYGYYLERQLWNNYGFGGYGYVGFQNNTITKLGTWNTSGFKSLEAMDQTSYPGLYSLDNKGMHGDNINNGHIYFYFKNKNHRKAKVIYLKQPNGGSFDFSWIVSSKKVTVDTNSEEYDLGVIEIEEENLGKYTGVACSNCNGKIVIFGVYLYNEKGAIFTRLGKGGDKLINHAKTDDGFRERWLDILNPDIYLYNGGANDRDDWDGATYLRYLKKYLTPFINKNTHTVCIRCNDISGDNKWDTVFEPILEKFAKDNKLDYISDKKILGDYPFAMGNGYMLEGVHPSELGNVKRANFYASFLNLPTVNFNNNNNASNTTELSYHYNTKLTEKYIKVPNGMSSTVYKIGITNAYTIGLLTLNIVGQRNGSNNMCEKTYKMMIGNGTVNNKVTSLGDINVVNNYEYHNGSNPVVDFTLAANLVDDLLEISITPNTNTYDMNFYIKGEITMTYLTIKGQCVWEN